MVSILDAAVHVGVETAFGAATVPSVVRSYEARADTHTLQTQRMYTPGFRRGLQATPAGRVRIRPDGATGGLELSCLTGGMNLLFAAMLARTFDASPTDGIYTHVFTTDTDASLATLATQVARPTTEAGTLEVFTYRGGVCTGWEIGQALDEEMRLQLDMTYREEVRGVTEWTGAYPDAFAYDYHDITITLGGEVISPKEFTIKAEPKWKTDRKALASNGLRRAPRRGGVPEFGGSLNGEFNNSDLYDAFINNVELPLEVTWEAPGGRSIVMTTPAIQFTGETPHANISDLSTQDGPYEVRYDPEEGPAVTFTVSTPDASY